MIIGAANNNISFENSVIGYPWLNQFLDKISSIIFVNGYFGLSSEGIVKHLSYGQLFGLDETYHDAKKQHLT